MRIAKEDNQQLVLTESYYDVLFGCILFFFIALSITATNLRTVDSYHSLELLAGPILMILSITVAMMVFRRIEIHFDKEQLMMIRTIKRITKTTVERIPISDLLGIELVPLPKTLSLIPGSTKADLYLTFPQTEPIKINAKHFCKRRATKIGSRLAGFFNITLSIQKEESIVEAVSHIKDIFK